MNVTSSSKSRLGTVERKTEANSAVEKGVCLELCLLSFNLPLHTIANILCIQK